MVNAGAAVSRVVRVLGTRALSGWKLGAVSSGWEPRLELFQSAERVLCQSHPGRCESAEVGRQVPVHSGFCGRRVSAEELFDVVGGLVEEVDGLGFFNSYLVQFLVLSLCIIIRWQCTIVDVGGGVTLV